MGLASTKRESNQLDGGAGLDGDFVLPASETAYSVKGEFHLTNRSFILVVHLTQFPFFSA